MHWTNALSLFLLLMSGLNIFNAHPALYWGKSSYRGVPPVLETLGRSDDQGKISGITRSWVAISTRRDTSGRPRTPRDS